MQEEIMGNRNDNYLKLVGGMYKKHKEGNRGVGEREGNESV
jgi:hypothetical protein